MLPPLARGMAAYALMWPLGSCLQQKLLTHQPNPKMDWPRVARFSLYGSCYVAPTLFLWVRLSSRIFPGSGLRVALKKALTEQVTYGPFAICSFFSGMTLLEGGSVQQAQEQVSNKFLPTYMVGVCVWPVLQTVNFTLVPEKNRVPFVALCSLLWTTFLAYIKYVEERTSASHSQM